MMLLSLVLEKAPESLRGGNSALTMNFRFYHHHVDDLIQLIDPSDYSADKTSELKRKYVPYSQVEFYDDVMSVNAYQSNEHLVHILVQESLPTIQCLERFVEPDIFRGHNISAMGITHPPVHTRRSITQSQVARNISRHLCNSSPIHTQSHRSALLSTTRLRLQIVF